MQCTITYLVFSLLLVIALFPWLQVLCPFIFRVVRLTLSWQGAVCLSDCLSGWLAVLLSYAMVDEHKELVFNRESEHCVFPLDFNGRVPGGPSARFSVS